MSNLIMDIRIRLRRINDKYVSKWLSLRIFQYFMREYIYCFSIFSIFHKLIVFWKTPFVRPTWGQKTKLVPLVRRLVKKFYSSHFPSSFFSSLCDVSNSRYRHAGCVCESWLCRYVGNVSLCYCLFGWGDRTLDGGLAGLQGVGCVKCF